jgi:hypothetical protein
MKKYLLFMFCLLFACLWLVSCDKKSKPAARNLQTTTPGQQDHDGSDSQAQAVGDDSSNPASKGEVMFNLGIGSVLEIENIVVTTGTVNTVTMDIACKDVSKKVTVKLAKSTSSSNIKENEGTLIGNIDGKNAKIYFYKDSGNHICFGIGVGVPENSKPFASSSNRKYRITFYVNSSGSSSTAVLQSHKGIVTTKSKTIINTKAGVNSATVVQKGTI